MPGNSPKHFQTLNFKPEILNSIRPENCKLLCNLSVTFFKMPGISPKHFQTLNFKPEILNSLRPQLKTVDPKTVNYYVTFL